MWIIVGLIVRAPFQCDVGVCLKMKWSNTVYGKQKISLFLFYFLLMDLNSIIFSSFLLGQPRSLSSGSYTFSMALQGDWAWCLGVGQPPLWPPRCGPLLFGPVTVHGSLTHSRLACWIAGGKRWYIFLGQPNESGMRRSRTVRDSPTLI